jgi:hypothetical protein
MLILLPSLLVANSKLKPTLRLSLLLQVLELKLSQRPSLHPGQQSLPEQLLLRLKLFQTLLQRHKMRLTPHQLLLMVIQ